MFCGKCGANIPDGYEFCMKCGTKIDMNQDNTEIEHTINDNDKEIRKKKIHNRLSAKNSADRETGRRIEENKKDGINRGRTDYSGKWLWCISQRVRKNGSFEICKENEKYGKVGTFF